MTYKKRDVLLEEIVNLENDNEKFKILLRELFIYLEKEEESDSGTIFRPNKISSVRVLDTKRINEILVQLKELAK